MSEEGTMAEKTEGVDHMRAARSNLDEYDAIPGKVNAEERLTLASIHAQLAQAEQLARLNDLLGNVVEPVGGYLKVRNDGH